MLSKAEEQIDAIIVKGKSCPPNILRPEKAKAASQHQICMCFAIRFHFIPFQKRRRCFSAKLISPCVCLKFSLLRCGEMHKGDGRWCATERERKRDVECRMSSRWYHAVCACVCLSFGLCRNIYSKMPSDMLWLNPHTDRDPAIHSHTNTHPLRYRNSISHIVLVHRNIN